MSETRVVLVKPGDVLIFGNVGELCDDVGIDLAERLASVRDALGLAHIMLFEDDIDLAAVPGGA